MYVYTAANLLIPHDNHKHLSTNFMTLDIILFPYVANYDYICKKN